MVKERWPRKGNLSEVVEGGWGDLVSMAIVRNPMSRLASTYYDKIAKGKWAKWR